MDYPSILIIAFNGHGYSYNNSCVLFTAGVWCACVATSGLHMPFHVPSGAPTTPWSATVGCYHTTGNSIYCHQLLGRLSATVIQGKARQLSDLGETTAANCGQVHHWRWQREDELAACFRLVGIV